MTIKPYKNGKLVLKEEKISITVNRDSRGAQTVTLEDKVHRYCYYRFIDRLHTVEEKTAAAKTELEEYLKVRGQRTSWTPWKDKGLYQGREESHA